MPYVKYLILSISQPSSHTQTNFLSCRQPGSWCCIQLTEDQTSVPLMASLEAHLREEHNLPSIPIPIKELVARKVNYQSVNDSGCEKVGMPFCSLIDTRTIVLKPTHCVFVSSWWRD
jgi:hypothetical protein